MSVFGFGSEEMVHVQARPSSLDEAQIELDVTKTGKIRKFTFELNSSACLL